MAKSKVPGSESVKEQNDIFKQAEENFRELAARQAEIAKGLEGLTQQSSTFFQLAAEGAAKAAERMNDLDLSSAGTTQNIGGLTKVIEKQGKAFEKANKEAGFKKGGDGKNNVFEQLAKSSKVAKVGVTLLAGAFNLLGKAVKGITSILSGMWDVVTSILGAIPKMIGGLIDLGGRIFDSMIQGSEDVRQHMFEVRKALEKVKEKFGDTHKSAASDIKSFVSTAIGMYNRFGDSIFGSVEEASSFALELAGSGEMATILSKQLKESENEIIKFAKGLGTTGEESAALMNMAYSSGTDLVEIYKQIGQQSQGLASRLGLNAKVLAKNIQIATKDVKHFGKATIQAMSESAAYANKMGVSLDKIVGVLDKFDTFEDAANNVSKLSQAFGVNLDTMKLVEAETPEERLEMLKDSFNAAGKSLDSLSRRELSYAAGLIGLDEAATKNLLSNKNQANSLEEVKNASSEVANEMKSMGDVLKQVTKDIAMNLKQLTRETKGFFDTFIDGILTGIERTPEMQKIFKNISQALDAVFIAGTKLGAAFVNAFPGVKKMLDALGQFFNPAKIGEMFSGFTRSFESFFKSLKTGTGDVRELFSDLSKNLTDYFTSQGPAGSEFLQGVKEFWNAIKQIIATAILGIGDLIAEGLSFIADFFEGKRKLPSGKDVLSSAKSGLGKVGEELSPIGKAAMASFGKIGEQVGRIWEPLKESLKTSLKEAVDYLWEYLKEKISENKGKLFLGGLLGMAASGDGGLLGLGMQGLGAYRTYKQGKQIKELTELMKAAQPGLPPVPGPVPGPVPPAFVPGPVPGPVPPAFVPGPVPPASVPGPVPPASVPGPVPPASVGYLQALRARAAAPGGFQGFVSSTGGMALGSVASGIAASEIGRYFAKDAGMSEDAQAQVAGFSGVSGGAALGFMLGGPLGAVIGSGAGAIWTLGREIHDAYDKIEEMQQSAVKELENIEHNAEQLEIRFGIDPKTGKIDKNADYAMSDDALLDQYGALIGGRSWFSLDSTDADKIRRILEEKHQIAKKAQEDNAAKYKKLVEEKEKQEKKRKQEAQKKKDEDEYGAFMHALGVGGKGEINMLTFKQKIQEIDKTAKDVTKGSAKLKENFDTIRNQLKTMDFKLFGDDVDSQKKKNDMENAGMTMMHLLGIIKSMSLISAEAQAAAGQLTKFGDPTDKDSVASKAVTFVKNQKATLDAIINAFMTNASAGVGLEQSVSISAAKSNMSELKDTMTSAKDAFSNIFEIKDHIVAMGDSKNAISKEISDAAKRNIEQMKVPLLTLWTTIGSQLSPDSLKDENGVLRVQHIEKAMDSTKTAIEGVRDVFNSIGGVFNTLNTDATLNGMLGFSGTLLEFSTYVGEIADSVNSQRIADLKTKISEIKTLQSDLNDLLPEEQRVTLACAPSATSTVAAVTPSSAVVNPRQGLQINMKFDIVMDSKALEKTLVTRSDSLVVKAFEQMAAGTNKAVHVSQGYNLEVVKTGR